MATANLTPKVEKECLFNGEHIRIQKPVDFVQLAETVKLAIA